MANADHLAPYLGGQEMAVENGLPLGITAETDYPESNTPLPVGVQLTLYTDGVIEARARSGELFGFERAAAYPGAGRHCRAATAGATVRFSETGTVA